MKEITMAQYDEAIINILAQKKTILNKKTGKKKIVNISPAEMLSDIIFVNNMVKIVKENKEKEDCE